MIISEKLYSVGYRIDGEGRRLDVITPENKKHFEIFFFPKEVLVMSSDSYTWCNGIKRIFLDQGKPQIELF